MGCLQTNSYSELPETRAILPVDPQNCSPSSFSEANPGSLKNHSFSLSGLRQIHVEPTVGLCRKSAVYGLNGLRLTLRVGALRLSPRPRSALLLPRPLSVGRFALLRFRPKNLAHHIFQLESELQNIPEAAPKAPPSFSVSEKLARYGSSALSGVEHLTLLVGKESVALALIRHFGSLKALARATFQELRQFLPRHKAEAVVAALSMSAIAETEHARSEQLDNPESIYRACADMKLFNQEVLSVILLDTRYRHISTVEITKGSINESLAHPRDIFRPVIGQSAYAFVLVHNL